MMKKTVARKKSTNTTIRTKKRGASKMATAITFIPFNFRRIVIWGLLSCLVLAILLTLNGQQLSPAVAGTNIYRGIVAHYQATVELPDIPEAIKYNIYYKKSDEPVYTHAVRNIPASIHSYLISSLRNNVKYVYRISAVDKSGAEFWWSSVYPLNNIQAM